MNGRKLYLILLIVLASAAIAYGLIVASAGAATARAPVAKAAVRGYEARAIAAFKQGTLCGRGFWWRCSDSTHPYPSCYGAGGGTWNCYGGVLDHHRVIFNRFKHCDVYVYVDRYGGTAGLHRYNCTT